MSILTALATLLFVCSTSVALADEPLAKLDSVKCALGGLVGQIEYAHLPPEWIGAMKVDPAAFRFTGFAAGAAEAAMAANMLSAEDGGATVETRNCAIQSPGDCDGSICASGHVHEGPLLCVQGWAVAPFCAARQDRHYLAASRLRRNRRAHGQHRPRTLATPGHGGSGKPPRWLLRQDDGRHRTACDPT